MNSATSLNSSDLSHLDDHEQMLTSSSSKSLLDDVLDLTNVDISDDRTWLLGGDNVMLTTNVRRRNSHTKTNNDTTDEIVALLARLHLDDERVGAAAASPPSNVFDPRTFTRQKKRTPNEDVVQLSNSTKPQFDFAQPTSCNYLLNKVTASLANNTSYTNFFQDTSPPSLVNSIRSTTFATLMENSFIKNDPVLCEIRDTDYTQSILQMNDSDHSIYHSLTESCGSSSIGSDVPERFLSKVEANQTDDIGYQSKVASLEVNNSYKSNGGGSVKEKLNTKLHTTFTKADNIIKRDRLSSAKQISQNSQTSLTTNKSETSRIEKEVRSITLNSTFKGVDSEQQGNTNLDGTFHFLLNHTTTSASSPTINTSLACINYTRKCHPKDIMNVESSDSSDQQDFMSISNTSSNSSKSSTNLLKTSTPKHINVPKPCQVNVLDNNQESSVVIRTKSVSDLSRLADEQLSCETAFKVKKNHDNNNTITKELSCSNNVKMSIDSKSPMKNLRHITAIHSNLRQISEITGSQPNLRKLPRMHSSIKSNPNIVSGQGIRGSYTNLKPVSSHIPTVGSTLLQNGPMQSRSIILHKGERTVNNTTESNRNKPQLRSALPRPIVFNALSSKIPAPANSRLNKIQPRFGK